MRTADGTTVPVSLSASPVRAADGRVVAVSVVARDERARIAADAELRFRDAILAAVDDAVLATDTERRVVYWSPGAERLFGIRAADALGRLIGDVSPVQLIGITAAAALTAIEADGSVRFDAVYTRPDGSTFVGETGASLALRPQGGTVHLAVVRDVTDIRRAATDSARLAAVVQGAGDMIIGTNLDAVVQSWNAAAERALGYAAQEMIGRTIAVYIAPEHLPLAFDLRRRLTDGGRRVGRRRAHVRHAGRGDLPRVGGDLPGPRRRPGRSSASRRSATISGSARASRRSCARPRSSRRSDGWPGASPTTSTTC